MTRARTQTTSTILVVEDDTKLSELYQTLLRQAGYTVHIAHDGQEALLVADVADPALILLDLRMPRMDGLEFLRHYDLKQKHPSVKVIIFSNYDLEKEVDEAYRLGAEHYIVKKWVSLRELLQIVENALADR